MAIGVRIEQPAVAPQLLANRIHDVVGGPGGAGGQGGTGNDGSSTHQGGATYHGTPGKAGGPGGDAGPAGIAVGVDVSTTRTVRFENNLVFGVVGGVGGPGGRGGSGGVGGHGTWVVGGDGGHHAGRGGIGGPGGDGTNGAFAATIRSRPPGTAGPTLDVVHATLIGATGGAQGAAGGPGPGGRGGTIGPGVPQYAESGAPGPAGQPGAEAGGGSAVDVRDGTEVVIAYSILAGEGDGVVLDTGSGVGMSHCIVHGFDAPFVGFTPDPSVRVVDPGFIDADAGDHRLQVTSPAVDAAHGSTLQVDLEGKQRNGVPDIGAYEIEG